jgi:hypothetical protein
VCVQARACLVFAKVGWARMSLIKPVTVKQIPVTRWPSKTNNSSTVMIV